MSAIHAAAKQIMFHLPPLRSFARGVAREPLWGLDLIRCQQGVLEIEGWALPPESGPGDADFTLNGRPFEHVEYPRERDDIGRVFWWLKGSARSGFRCRTHFAAANGSPLALDYVSRSSGRPFSGLHGFAVRQQDGLPLPAPERRQRVQGSDSECFFLQEGCSAYVKLEQALREHAGKSYGEFSRVLDWGCGCGRLARHFAPGLKPRLTGVDIDGDNVAWCRENLGFAEFAAVPLHPPTDLPAGGFDLLIGISVFTHLAEDVQREWLGELRRLAAPGAILLMTVHGLTSAVRCGRPAHLLRFLASRGCYNMGACIDLDGFISDSEYYQSVYLSERYIRRHWSDYFEVVSIIPGYIGNNQDLVILRRTR